LINQTVNQDYPVGIGAPNGHRQACHPWNGLGC
jgi:hypothetical protein